jgi:hypothetical protein
MIAQFLIPVCAVLTAAAALTCVFLLRRFLNAAQQQAALAARQQRETLRPILLCTALTSLDDGRRIAHITNQSPGVALDIAWTADDSEPSPASRANGPSLVLGPHSVLELAFAATRTTRLLFVYTSTFGDRSRTEVLIIADLYSNRYFPEPAAP